MKKLNFLIALIVLFATACFDMSAQGKVKVSGWVNNQFQLECSDGEYSDSFRIRRARASISGDLNEIVSYKLQADFAGSPILVDYYVNLKLRKAAQLKLGQFKFPLTMESTIAPMNLDVIDYGTAISKLAGYSDVSGVGKNGRDIGVSLHGEFLPAERNGKNWDYVDYELCLINGNGINNLDNNKHKDVVGRLQIHPLKELTVGASFYNGKARPSGASADITRNRCSAGIEYSNRLSFRSEYIWGLTDNTKSGGAYAQASYWILPDCLRAIVRYDTFTQDREQKSTCSDLYTGGLMWRIFKFMDLKAMYSMNLNRVLDTETDKIVVELSYKF